MLFFMDTLGLSQQFRVVIMPGTVSAIELLKYLREVNSYNNALDDWMNSFIPVDATTLPVLRNGHQPSEKLHCNVLSKCLKNVHVI